MGGAVTLEEVKIYQGAVGKPLACVYFWNNGYEDPHFPYKTAGWIRANGSVPYVRMMLLSSPKIPRPDPVFFFFQAEDGIRDTSVTGVQTCALPILGQRAQYHAVVSVEGLHPTD